MSDLHLSMTTNKENYFAFYKDFIIILERLKAPRPQSILHIILLM